MVALRRALLLALLFAPAARASDMNQAPVSSPGISTGAATTASMTGNGQAGNPLAVNPSSVPFFNANHNLTLPYGVVAPTATFTIFSSAPVVYVSTIASLFSHSYIFGNDGFEFADFDLSGVRGLRLYGAGSDGDGITGILELSNSSDPWMYYRRNDTTVTAGELLGGVMWRDKDSSTGGNDNRQYDIVEADGGWSSNQQFATIRRLGINTKAQSEPQDVMVISSTGTLISHSSLGASEAGTPIVACGTCTLQVVSPSGSGADIVGNLSVSGATKPGIRTKAQLDATTPVIGDTYYCSDCAVPYDICQATGATLSGFRAAINSAINTAIPGTLVPKGCGTNN